MFISSDEPHSHPFLRHKAFLAINISKIGLLLNLDCELLKIGASQEETDFGSVISTIYVLYTVGVKKIFILMRQKNLHTFPSTVTLTCVRISLSHLVSRYPHQLAAMACRGLRLHCTLCTVEPTMLQVAKMRQVYTDRGSSVTTEEVIKSIFFHNLLWNAIACAENRISLLALVIKLWPPKKNGMKTAGWGKSTIWLDMGCTKNSLFIYHTPESTLVLKSTFYSIINGLFIE